MFHVAQMIVCCNLGLLRRQERKKIQAAGERQMFCFPSRQNEWQPELTLKCQTYNRSKTVRITNR